MKVLVKSADGNAEKAESGGKLYLITKSNGLRRVAKEVFCVRALFFSTES